MHWPALDGLRGLAILAVLLFHFSDPFRLREHTPLGTLLARGSFGVDLFFVLSGFLITGILIDTKGSANYFFSFYSRRFLRIFPLYYGFLAVFFFCLWPLSGDAEFFRPVEQRWYWVYLSNWGDPLGHGIPALGHFWSLAIEEQFYLIWPLLVALLSRRLLLWACIGLIIGAFCVRLGLLFYCEIGPSRGCGQVGVEMIHRMTLGRVDVLAMGALLALCVREPTWLELARKVLRRLFGPALLALIALLWRSRFLHYDTPWTLTVGYSAIGLCGALLVHQAVAAGKQRSLTKQLLEAAWLRSLGRYSYGIYVLHFPIHAAVMQRVRQAPDRSPLKIALAQSALVDTVYLLSGIAVSFTLAWVVWHIYERPFLRWKRFFAARPLV
jgi:peptidoglycan/LPS O-acetylase OafA/YrhL